MILWNARQVLWIVHSSSQLWLLTLDICYNVSKRLSWTWMIQSTASLETTKWANPTITICHSTLLQMHPSKIRMKTMQLMVRPVKMMMPYLQLIEIMRNLGTPEPWFLKLKAALGLQNSTTQLLSSVINLDDGFQCITLSAHVNIRCPVFVFTTTSPFCLCLVPHTAFYIYAVHNSAKMAF